MRWLDSITDLMDMNVSQPCEIVEDRGTWCPTAHGVTRNWTQLKRLNNSNKDPYSTALQKFSELFFIC